jgi:hypothetical protein
MADTVMEGFGVGDAYNVGKTEGLINNVAVGSGDTFVRVGDAVTIFVGVGDTLINVGETVESASGPLAFVCITDTIKNTKQAMAIAGIIRDFNGILPCIITNQSIVIFNKIIGHKIISYKKIKKKLF